MIPIYKPFINKETIKYAHEALDSTWISSKGIYLDKAQEKLKELLNTKYVKLVNNGTSATHLTIKALLRKNKNIKNIIVPNNVYVAAWNSALYENLNLISIDADLETWNADYGSISCKDYDPNETAIMLVHNIGNIINIERIKKRFPEFAIIEDNCEGFLGKYGDAYSGTKSLCSSLSFFGNKTITSGEGGAIVTTEEEIYEFLDSIQGQGQSKERRYVHDELGYNYRMSNIQAAILYGQLKNLNEILDRKQTIFEKYKKELSKCESISFQSQELDTKHSNWMFAIKTKKSFETLSKHLYDNNIENRQMFFPMSEHFYLKHIADKSREKNASHLNQYCILLPSYPELAIKDVKFICDTVLKFLDEK